MFEVRGEGEAPAEPHGFLNHGLNGFMDFTDGIVGNGKLSVQSVKSVISGVLLYRH